MLSKCRQVQVRERHHTFLMKHGRARGEQVTEQPPLQPEVVRGVGGPLYHPLDTPVWWRCTIQRVLSRYIAGGFGRPQCGSWLERPIWLAIYENNECGVWTVNLWLVSPHTHLSVSASPPLSRIETPAGFGHPSKNISGRAAAAAEAEAAEAEAAEAAGNSGGAGGVWASTRNSRQKPIEFCCNASIEGTTWCGGVDMKCGMWGVKGRTGREADTNKE